MSDPRASIPPDTYPLATQDGQAIPLDVVKPTRLLILAAGDEEALTEQDILAFITATKGPAIIRFTPSSGNNRPGAMFIPQDKTRKIALPYYELQTIACEAIAGETAPVAYVQFIENWSGIISSLRFKLGY